MSLRKDFIDSLLDGASRLHRAAATETEHQVRDLINRGADPNLRNWRGETPLHRAAIRNPDLDVHRALIDAGARCERPRQHRRHGVASRGGATVPGPRRSPD